MKGRKPLPESERRKRITLFLTDWEREKLLNYLGDIRTVRVESVYRRGLGDIVASEDMRDEPGFHSIPGVYVPGKQESRDGASDE